MDVMLLLLKSVMTIFYIKECFEVHEYDAKLKSEVQNSGIFSGLSFLVDSLA